MDTKPSISEDHGVAALTDDDLKVYSIGISTGGAAEIRMAEANSERHIVATTIDKEGLAFAKKHITQKHLDGQIEAKLEDVAKPLPYPDEHFDFVYARLILHYLPKDMLTNALAELHRVLRTGGKLYVVVRSTDCPDAKRRGATYDPKTCLTSCNYTDETGKPHSYSRYFHSEASISHYLTEAGFSVTYCKKYDEQLYRDFMRTRISPVSDNVIELLTAKA